MVKVRRQDDDVWYRKPRSRCIILLVLIGLLVIVIIAVAVALAKKGGDSLPPDPLERAKALMKRVPLVDGHNDLPWQLKLHFDNRLENIDMYESTADKFDEGYGHTDIPRLRQGMVGAQFWAAYVACSNQYKDPVRFALEQIDVIKRFTNKYSEVFEFVTTAQGILDAFNKNKIGSMIGVEGGHAFDSHLGNLRMLYDVGARYVTITHSCNTPWADNWKCSQDNNPEFGGLSEWGELVIREMNRLGMLIDLSHVSFDTMHDTLRITEAPVIFSHSSAFAICAHHRNVPDDVLEKVKENGGVVMVNFYEKYINCPPMNQSVSDIKQVADHIDYLKSKCGVDCVGIGSDYDGVDVLPEGLGDVSTFPDLIAEMIRRGWSDEDIEKLLGNNLIRAFKEAEKVRDRLSSSIEPYDETIPRDSGEEANNTCRHYIYNPDN
ncbi:dipeptidase 1-like [Ptychodera flava]|uniref:dipeptidase 1-like n=1 Tax=Ptychodera flava TaxID=63121 RepID=UPI00396A6C26